MSPSSIDKNHLRCDDRTYIHAIAKRAVVRACLHMGIARMSQEALNTLADALVHYISQLAHAMAVAVESSGRSTTHIHIMDAIRAIEFQSQALSSSWTDLAAFTLGPDWWKEKHTINEIDVARATTTNTTSTSENDSPGWNAPYPDEIIDFPRRNFYFSGSGTKKQIDENDNLPDQIFKRDVYWGEPDPLVVTEDGPSSLEEPNPKRQRTNEEEGDPKNSSYYIPTHFPPLPSLKEPVSRMGVAQHSFTGSRNETTTSPTSKDQLQISSDVRSALVDLGKHTYWGSTWTDGDKDLKVPAGQSSSQQPQIVPAQIVPVGSASSSRVARILEGSVDASAIR